MPFPARLFVALSTRNPIAPALVMRIDSLASPYPTSPKRSMADPMRALPCSRALH